MKILRWLFQSRSAWATLVRLALIAAACILVTLRADPFINRLSDIGLIWRNVLPVCLVGFFVYALCGRMVFSAWLTAVLTYLLYAVNAIKEQNMNMPLMPGDLALKRQLAGNIGFFEHYVTHGMVAAALIVAFLLISGLIWWLERREARPSWIMRVFWLVVPAVCLVTMFRGDGFWPSTYSSKAIADFRLWNPAKSVSKSGLVAGLVYMFEHSNVVVPPANRALVQRFANHHVADLKEREARPVPQSLPDIVVVQSEAFFDPGIMKQIGFGQFDPHFDRLAKSGISGFLKTPAYGGGTIRTEFETLTGYPMRAFPSVVYPYYGLVASWMPSMPRRLEAMGYSTTLFHPFLGEFWNRKEVMPELGFQKMYFQKDFVGAKRAGRHVSDRALFQFVFEHLKSNDSQPQFAMAITMENHGLWNGDPGPLSALLKGHPLPTGLSVKGKREMRYYLSHLMNGDAALGDFVKKLMARKRWTILLFYGDHLPALSHAFREVGFDNGQANGAQRTRYMLLSNRPLQPRTLNLHAYALPGLVFDVARLPMDGYLAFDGAVREAWVKSGLNSGVGLAPVLYNAARMEVSAKHKLSVQGHRVDGRRKAAMSCVSGSCDNDKLSVALPSGSACDQPGGPVAATVRWRAGQNGNHQFVQIWIRSPGKDGKPGKGTLWTEKEAAGSAKTGKWIFPGTRIVLKDAVSGARLSVFKVPDTLCAAH